MIDYISKSVMIIISVEFIDQIIDYPINCDSLSKNLTIIFGPLKDINIRYILVISLFTDKRLGTFGMTKSPEII